MRELHTLVEKVVGHSMGGYQLHHMGKPMDEQKQQKEMTLKDYSIKADSILAMTRMGRVLNVTNPMVSTTRLL